MIRLTGAGRRPPDAAKSIGRGSPKKTARAMPRRRNERCYLKRAHGFLSYARPKFWDSARVLKTNIGLGNNELMLSPCIWRNIAR
jgi:hypothetical protein